MANRRRAVIFDLDGTLVDSAGVARRSFSDAFRACGLDGEPPTEEFVGLSGVPLEDVCVRLGLPPGFAAQYRESSHNRRIELSVFPGIREILSKLASQRVPMAIITSKDRVRTLQTLDQLNLSSLFSAVATPEDPPAAKPSPEGVFWLCERLNVSADDSVVVGDSVIDIRTGTSAGSNTIGCTWGVGSAAALREAGASTVVETTAELSAELLLPW